jgi:hypothetical protein
MLSRFKKQYAIQAYALILPIRAKEEKRMLAVLSKGVIAFGASHKLSGRLICSACLNLPNISRVVPAPWAFYTSRWQCIQLLLLFANYSYQLLRTMLNNLWRNFGLDVFVCFRLLVTAFGAGKNQSCFFTALRLLWFKT